MFVGGTRLESDLSQVAHDTLNILKEIVFCPAPESLFVFQSLSKSHLFPKNLRLLVRRRYNLS